MKFAASVLEILRKWLSMCMLAPGELLGSLHMLRESGSWSWTLQLPIFRIIVLATSIGHDGQVEGMVDCWVSVWVVEV